MAYLLHQTFIMDMPLKLEAPWAQVKEMLKEVNSDLTDADLAYEMEQPHDLLQRLAKKMNRSPEEIRTWIESVSHNRVKAS